MDVFLEMAWHYAMQIDYRLSDGWRNIVLDNWPSYYSRDSPQCPYLIPSQLIERIDRLAINSAFGGEQDIFLRLPFCWIFF
jgi:hypothetical protein